MSKDLPYFRFYTAEWQNGDITLEDDETQGVFINVCCYYWTKDCDVTKQMLSKRFASAKQVLDKLFFAKIIKESATGLLEINFLDEQYERLVGLSKKRSKAGKLGGLAKVANAKQMPSKCLANAKQMPIYKDKDKDKDLTGKISPWVGESIKIVFGLNPQTKTECTRFNKLKREVSIKAKNETELKAVAAKYKNEMPNVSFTPEAVLKHWDSLKNKERESVRVVRKRIWVIDDHARKIEDYGYEGYLTWCREQAEEVLLNDDKSVRTH